MSPESLAPEAGAASETELALPPEILAMMAKFEAEAATANAEPDVEVPSPVEPFLSEDDAMASETAADEHQAAFEAVGMPGETGAPIADAEAGELVAAPALGEASATDTQTLVLDPVLDLTATAALHTALLARRGQPLDVDARQVKRLGGQCLQLLLSAGRTWGLDGVPLTLSGVSEAFRRDLALMGFAERPLFENEAA